ncbi:hypothetical protein B0H13DRAFT_2345509 [Mycena leptocephala]|nr:hypothetical protein B0H13DRAFT_2345509 [Mycena leptocephala]
MSFDCNRVHTLDTAKMMLLPALPPSPPRPLQAQSHARRAPRFITSTTNMSSAAAEPSSSPASPFSAPRAHEHLGILCVVLLLAAPSRGSNPTDKTHHPHCSSSPSSLAAPCLSYILLTNPDNDFPQSTGLEFPQRAQLEGAA